MRSILCLLFVLHCTCVLAQSTRADSVLLHELSRRLKGAAADSVRGPQLLDSIVDVADRLGTPHAYYRKQEARARLALARKDAASARTYYTAALERAQTEGDDREIAGFYYDLTSSLRGEGDYERMLEFLLEGLPYAQRAGDPDQLGSFYNALGIVQRRTGNQEAAIVSYRSAEAIFRKINREGNRFSPILNIAAVYQDMERVDSARHYFELARTVAEGRQPPNLRQIAFVENNLANLLNQQREYGAGLRSARRAYDIFSTPPVSEEGRRAAGVNLATALRGVGRPAEAIPYLRESLLYYQSIGDVFSQSKMHHGLARDFHALGVADSVRFHYERTLVLRDSLSDEQRMAAIAEMSTKYETDLREQEIEQLETTTRRRGWLLVAALATAGLLGGLLWFALRQRRRVTTQKAVLETLNTQKDTLLREIHHRVKNNLQMVSSLLSLQSEFIQDDAALDALQMGQRRVRSMAIIHQKLYLRDEATTAVSARAYLEQLIAELMGTLNITGVPLRLEKELEDIDLDIDRMIPLGLIANEVITNSMKYAFVGRDSGLLQIRFRRVGPDIELSIADDGSGMGAAAVSGGAAFGSLLIQTFTEQLEGELEVESGAGTVVRLRFPANG